MKIRLLGSTLRLRLRQSDIEKLKTNGRIEDKVHFPSGALTYSLNLDDSAATIQADLKNNEIAVSIPKAEGLRWCNGPEISLTEESATPAILIERDFVRTAVEEPDDYDRFTNPRSGRRPPSPPA